MPATEASPASRPTSTLRVMTYRTDGPGTTRNTRAAGTNTANVDQLGIRGNLREPGPGVPSVWRCWPDDYPANTTSRARSNRCETSAQFTTFQIASMYSVFRFSYCR